MVVGGYSLHVYCDWTGMDNPSYDEECPASRKEFIDHKYLYQGKGPHPLETDGPNKRAALKEAKEAGWRIRGNRAVCAGCQKLGRDFTTDPFQKS